MPIERIPVTLASLKIPEALKDYDAGKGWFRYFFGDERHIAELKALVKDISPDTNLAAPEHKDALFKLIGIVARGKDRTIPGSLSRLKFEMVYNNLHTIITLNPESSVSSPAAAAQPALPEVPVPLFAPKAKAPAPALVPVTEIPGVFDRVYPSKMAAAIGGGGARTVTSALPVSSGTYPAPAAVPPPPLDLTKKIYPPAGAIGMGGGAARAGQPPKAPVTYPAPAPAPFVAPTSADKAGAGVAVGAMGPITMADSNVGIYFTIVNKVNEQGLYVSSPLKYFLAFNPGTEMKDQLSIARKIVYEAHSSYVQKLLSLAGHVTSAQIAEHSFKAMIEIVLEPTVIYEAEINFEEGVSITFPDFPQVRALKKVALGVSQPQVIFNCTTNGLPSDLPGADRTKFAVDNKSFTVQLSGEERNDNEVAKLAIMLCQQLIDDDIMTGRYDGKQLKVRIVNPEGKLVKEDYISVPKRDSLTSGATDYRSQAIANGLTTSLAAGSIMLRTQQAAPAATGGDAASVAARLGGAVPTRGEGAADEMSGPPTVDSTLHALACYFKRKIVNTLSGEVYEAPSSVPGRARLADSGPAVATAPVAAPAAPAPAPAPAPAIPANLITARAGWRSAEERAAALSAAQGMLSPGLAGPAHAKEDDDPTAAPVSAPAIASAALAPRQSSVLSNLTRARRGFDSGPVAEVVSAAVGGGFAVDPSTLTLSRTAAAPGRTRAADPRPAVATAPGVAPGQASALGDFLTRERRGFTLEGQRALAMMGSSEAGYTAGGVDSGPVAGAATSTTAGIGGRAETDPTGRVGSRAVPPGRTVAVYEEGAYLRDLGSSLAQSIGGLAATPAPAALMDLMRSQILPQGGISSPASTVADLREALTRAVAHSVARNAYAIPSAPPSTQAPAGGGLTVGALSVVLEEGEEEGLTSSSMRRS